MRAVVRGQIICQYSQFPSRQYYILGIAFKNSSTQKNVDIIGINRNINIVDTVFFLFILTQVRLP